MDTQCTANKIRDELNRLHNIIDDCAHEAFSLENLFQTAIQLADSKSTRLGRSGYYTILIYLMTILHTYLFMTIYYLHPVVMLHLLIYHLQYI
uniref:Uncharacterized protein n=1 Tax=Ascaris lumbricoides TaxID=6252 RepID=A0A0M3IVJ2_ASCLU